MRNLILCLLFLLCAVGLLAACDNPERVARREVDRITRIAQRTEVNVKRTARAAMMQIATEEGTATGKQLKVLGCPAGAASQPATAPEPCKKAVADGKARYEARIKPVHEAAYRVDKAIGGVYASLIVVLDVLEDVAAGLKPGGWEAKLAGLVSNAVKLWVDVAEAYSQFKGMVVRGGVP